MGGSWSVLLIIFWLIARSLGKLLFPNVRAHACQGRTTTFSCVCVYEHHMIAWLAKHWSPPRMHITTDSQKSKSTEKNVESKAKLLLIWLSSFLFDPSVSNPISTWFRCPCGINYGLLVGTQIRVPFETKSLDDTLCACVLADTGCLDRTGPLVLLCWRYRC